MYARNMYIYIHICIYIYIYIYRCVIYVSIHICISHTQWRSIYLSKGTPKLVMTGPEKLQED